HRQTTDKFRNKAELEQIFRLALAQQLASPALLRRGDMRAEADGFALKTIADDLLQPRKRAAADQQAVRRIDPQKLLLGMLAPALRRHGGRGALHQLEQRLLHALARHIARDRRVLRLAADLVDLVNIDDAALRLLDIIVAGLQQLEDDVLDILAD